MFSKVFFKKQKFLLFLAFVFLFFPLFIGAVDRPWWASPPGFNPAVDIGIFAAERAAKGESAGEIAFGGIGTILATLLQWPLRFFLWLGGGLIWLGSIFIQFVASNPFNVPFTKPGDAPNGNPIIAIGWTLTRDFTNMLFILGFAYIGLATALGLSNFNTKKAFGNILIAALLINFTPVICGVIVDFSNIISNYFLVGLNFDEIPQSFTEHQANLVKNFKDVFTDWEIAVQVIFLITYGLLAGISLLLFAWILLFRGPIIWIFVILSPLAFFFWIFRDSIGQAKEWWGLWWKHFLNWSLIAIPTGFFLYLSKQTIVKAGDLVAAGGSGAFTLAPYFVAIIFMVFALFLVFKVSGIGSAAIFALGGAVLGLAAGATAGIAQHAKGAIGARWDKALKPGDEGYEDWKKENKINKIRDIAGKISRMAFGGQSEEEKKKWGVASGLVRTLGAPFTLGATFWAKPALRSISAGIEESSKKEIDEKYKKLKDASLETQVTAFRNALPGFLGSKQRIAALRALQNSGNLGDAGLSDKEIMTTLQDVLEFSPNKMENLKLINPKLTARVVNKMGWLSKSARELAGVDFNKEKDEKYKGLDVYRSEIVKDDQGNIIRDAQGHIMTTLVKEELDPLEAKLTANIKPKHIDFLTPDAAVRLVGNESYHKFGNISDTLSKLIETHGAGKILNPFIKIKNELTNTAELISEWNVHLPRLQELMETRRTLERELKAAKLDKNTQQRDRLNRDIYNIDNEIEGIEGIARRITEANIEFYGESIARFFESSTGQRIGVSLGPKRPVRF